MSQLTFAEAEYQNKKRKTRREIFLEKMDAIIPWKRLENRAAKHYPKDEMGRPPYPLSVMLRVPCLQHTVWIRLSAWSARPVLPLG